MNGNAKSARGKHRNIRSTKPTVVRDERVEPKRIPIAHAAGSIHHTAANMHCSPLSHGMKN